MKRLGLILLTLAVLACGTASAYNPYAPNPFDAIEQDSWEYKYILDLTKAGLTGADMAKFSPCGNAGYAGHSTQKPQPGDGSPAERNGPPGF